ncbi:MAG: Hsp33 family molecular chaperone HslO [Betaproteobacteria bacterium]|nr:Hsp33 family molecular chaperone HslO [Betaproteobacteria bacterium]
MADTLQRFLFEHAPIRGEIVRLDATWRAVLERHHYPPPLRAVLGELMAAAALLAATLKFSGSMVLQVHGSGPVSLIVVECTSAHTLRATAKWRGEIGSASLRELIGSGRFAITLISDGGRQSYQGVVAIDGESVASVLEHYMRNSEQLDTVIKLAASDERAAGLLVQKLPDSATHQTEDWRRAAILTATLSDAELLALAPQDILHRLYHEEDVRVFDPRPVAFRCSCSRKRVASMLRMLGIDEVRAIVRERGTIDVNCEFCNRAYTFDSVDAEQVLPPEHPQLASKTRH